MICICFLIMPYLTFVWLWVVDCKTEFSKYYQMIAILVKGEWIPEVITKFGWEEMIRSIQDTDFPWMRVGSLITCCSPNWQVTASVLERSKVVVSPVYKLLDFRWSYQWRQLKGLGIKNGLVAETTSRVSSKLLQKFLKPSSDWFGDMCKERNLQILSPSFISKVMHSLR